MLNTRLLILFVFTAFLCSCKGQVADNQAEKPYSHEVKDTSKTVQPDMPKPPWHPDYANQISQVVRMMYQDSRGTLWFGAQNGAYKVVGDSLVKMDSVKSKIGKGVTIHDIIDDYSGNVWLAHTDGLSCVTGNKVVNYYESDGLISNDVWCLGKDSKGRLWIGTVDGLCYFQNGKFTRFPLPEGVKDKNAGVSSTKMVHDILEDRHGVLWFCTNAGLFSLENQKLTHVSPEAGIKTNFVNKLYLDSKDNLWVSSQVGLYRLKNGIATNMTEGKIVMERGIGCVVEDKNGLIYVVANQHDLYTFSDNAFVKFVKTEDNKGPVTFQIFRDKDDRLWFVGFGGAFRLEDGKFVNVTKDGPW